MARGATRPNSDIDLAAAIDDARPLSLLDVIRLAELLGQPVDLIEDGTPAPRVRRRVHPESVSAFTDPSPRFNHDF
jgi:predicted nucleotidyltransferase